MCVCPSVTALAASASVFIRKQQYARVSLRLFLDFESWNFAKVTICNKLELTASSCGTNETQQLRVTSGSNVASEASYWCNRCETSEIQARSYSGQRGTRTCMCSTQRV